MAKIVSIIVTMLLLNVAMFMFTFSGDDCGDDCQLSQYNTEANNTILNYFADPTQQSKSTLWENIFGVAGILAILTAGGAIVIGAVYITKDLNVAYITLSSFLVLAVMGTWVRFWMFINDSSFVLGGTSGGVVAMILVGTLMAVQLFQIIDWGRGVN
jgi:hypothetical protein